MKILIDQSLRIDEVTAWYLHELERLQHFPILQDGGGRSEYPENNKEESKRGVFVPLRGMLY
jgi:hypothetical protein